jgi:hypothetical protein
MQRKEQDIIVVAIRPFCACHSLVQSFGLASYSLDYGSVLGLWCQGAGRGTQRGRFFACISGECGSCSCRSPFMCARAQAVAAAWEATMELGEVSTDDTQTSYYCSRARRMRSS